VVKPDNVKKTRSLRATTVAWQSPDDMCCELGGSKHSIPIRVKTLDCGLRRYDGLVFMTALDFTGHLPLDGMSEKKGVIASAARQSHSASPGPSGFAHHSRINLFDFID
jgi:hypothetical protein